MVKKLKQYSNTKKEIEKLGERIARLENSMFSPRISKISDMPKSPSHEVEHITENIARLDELKARYSDIVLKLCEQQIEVEEAIVSLEPVERELIRLRYFDELPWWKISNELHYGQRQVFNIHKNVLKKLKKQQ